MALDIEGELAALEKISGLDEKHHLTLSKHVARLQAAIQLEIARETIGAQRHLIDAQREVAASQRQIADITADTSRALVDAQRQSADAQRQVAEITRAASQDMVGAQRQTAEIMARASAELRGSIDAFTAVSDKGSAEAMKWSKRMTLATYALLIAALVQAGAAVAQVIVALNPRPSAAIAAPATDAIPDAP